MKNSKLKYTLLILLIQLVSCSNPNFVPLSADKHTNVLMEGRYWRGFFDKSSDFELRITNNTNSDLKNCVLVFDNKYKHTVQGLHSIEKGMIKDSLFRRGERLTFQFNSDISNLTFFNVPGEKYFPEFIELEYDSVVLEWKFK